MSLPGSNNPNKFSKQLDSSISEKVITELHQATRAIIQEKSGKPNSQAVPSIGDD